MLEKIIFEGRLEAKIQEVQSIINNFLHRNFILPIDSGEDFQVNIENHGNKQVLVIIRPQNRESEKIYNGYIEINPVLLFDQSVVEIRIVSCRPELDLLYFQLSQQIQARFIIPGFPPEVLTTPWRTLFEEGFISPNKNSVDDIANDIPDPDNFAKKYGNDRSLTANDVRRFVKKCRAYTERGGTVNSYYDDVLINPPFELETLRSWLKNPKFISKNP